MPKSSDLPRRLSRLAGLLLLGGGALLPAASATGAKAPSCHGRRATIVVKSGQTVVGTAHRDVILVELRGHPDLPRSRTVVHARGGDDIICGSVSQDVLLGEGGNDWIAGAGGLDRIGGGAGNDVISGAWKPYLTRVDNASDLFGGPGNDRISAGEGNEEVVLSGGPGNDWIDAGGNVDGHTEGGNGNRARGGPGDDTLISHGAPEQELAGGAGDDTLRVGRSAEENPATLLGGGGADRIEGGPGDDLIRGDRGPGKPGPDRIDGGGGKDTIYGEADADQIEAGPGNDTVYGEDGADQLAGGPGNDQIDPAAGDDHVDGGAGNDTVSASAGADTIAGGPGADTIDGGPENDVISGGEDADLLSGEEGDDTISGEGGDDMIVGGSGNDTMFGNDGADHCSGQAGEDSCDGGAPSPVDPTQDPDRCDADVEHRKDCAEGVVTEWVGSWSGTVEQGYGAETWTLSGNLDYVLDPAESSSQKWVYKMDPLTLYSTSVTGADAVCTWSGSGSVHANGLGELIVEKPHAESPTYSLGEETNDSIQVNYACEEGPQTLERQPYGLGGSSPFSATATALNGTVDYTVQGAEHYHATWALSAARLGAGP